MEVIRWLLLLASHCICIEKDICFPYIINSFVTFCTMEQKTGFALAVGLLYKNRVEPSVSISYLHWVTNIPLVAWKALHINLITLIYIYALASNIIFNFFRNWIQQTCITWSLFGWKRSGFPTMASSFHKIEFSVAVIGFHSPPVISVLPQACVQQDTTKDHT